MKMKLFLTAACVVLLSLGQSSQASAQFFPGRGCYGYNRGFGYSFGGPRVMIAVRPPIRPYAYRYAPRGYARPYGYGYRNYRNRGYDRSPRSYNRHNDDRNYNDRYRERDDYRNDDRSYNDNTRSNDDMYDNGEGDNQNYSEEGNNNEY